MLKIKVSRSKTEEAGFPVFLGENADSMSFAYSLMRQLERKKDEVSLDRCIFCFLDYFKANGYENVFDEFYHYMAKMDERDNVWEMLYWRAKQDKELIQTYKNKNADQVDRREAHYELVKRGFIDADKFKKGLIG